MQRELDVAIKAARSAGELIERMQQASPAAHAKGVAHNIVTEADLAAEKLILGMLTESFPDHSILSEEGGGAEQQSSHLWAVDPLDGTNNYAHRFPHYAVSIALWTDGQPAVGVIYDPTRDELFHAVAGQGAFLNNVPIHVTSSASINDAILATGFYYDRGDMMRRTLKLIEGFFDQPIRGIRRTGSAALDLCYVACGRLDGFWELRLSPWDYAAGNLIVLEAGGRVTDVTGGPCRIDMNNVLVSNGHIHQQMLEVVRA